jgi:hypothetical protein
VWTDCDSKWLIRKNVGFYVEKELLGFRGALGWTDCDRE